MKKTKNLKRLKQLMNILLLKSNLDLKKVKTLLNVLTITHLTKNFNLTHPKYILNFRVSLQIISQNKISHYLDLQN